MKESDNMKNELLNIKLSDKGTIKSTELVEIINSFRELEGKKKLRHDNFKAKIDNEVKTLNSLGLSTDLNFKVSEYKDVTGRKLPCYELNRDGMLQMLNSESALVRFKTIEYTGKLEKQVRLLKEEKQKQIQLLKEKKQKLELEAKNRTILRLESANSKISKILQADNYISNEMYGEPTYITSIVINIFKKCSTKKNILKYEDDTYFIKSEPVKEEFMKYRIKPAEFKRYVEYFGGCQTRVKCKVKDGEYNIAIGCYAIPGFIIDWDMKDSVERLSY